jgi:hypothetical protein
MGDKASRIAACLIPMTNQTTLDSHRIVIKTKNKPKLLKNQQDAHWIYK